MSSPPPSLSSIKFQTPLAQPWSQAAFLQARRCPSIPTPLLSHLHQCQHRHPHQSGQVTGETGLSQHPPPDFQLPCWCGVRSKLLSGCSLILFSSFILFSLDCWRFFSPGKILMKFCFPPTPHQIKKKIKNQKQKQKPKPQMSQNLLLLLQNRILIVQQPQLIDRQRQSRQTCDGSGKKNPKPTKQERKNKNISPTRDTAQFPRTMLLP